MVLFQALVQMYQLIKQRRPARVRKPELAAVAGRREDPARTETAASSVSSEVRLAAQAGSG
jgi:hypothetical protein